MFQMCDEFKKAHVTHETNKEGEGAEIMSTKEALQFPIFAGGFLCLLYGMIKYFGKDAVNKLFLLYLALAMSELFK